MPEILPNPFTDPKKLPKRSLFDRPESEKDEKQSFIDQAMAQGLKAAQESTKKKFSNPELQKIWDNIEEKIESGEIKLHEIIIGGKSKEQLIKKIEVGGGKISGYPKLMIENSDFKTSEDEQDLELIELSVADLGFPGNTRRDEIYKRVVELGLEVVPAEIGPQLRLQYPDQPKNTILLIGMEPIEDSSGILHIFGLGRDYEHNTQFLTEKKGRPGYEWSSHERWIFRRPPSLKAATDVVSPHSLKTTTAEKGK